MLYTSFRFTRAKLEVRGGQVRYPFLHVLQNSRQKRLVSRADEYMIARMLLLLLGVLLLSGWGGRPLMRLLQRRLPHFAIESDQLFLWGGLLLSALSLGLLVLYLFLQP